MNLIEAVKSGRPFRRKNWLHWVKPEGDSLILLQGPIGGRLPTLVEDVLADDYEVDEPKVAITASQFWEAVNSTLHNRRGADELARKLGLVE